MYYDLIIFNAVNGLAGRYMVLDIIGIFFADYLPYIVVIFLLGYLFWPKKDRLKNRKMVFFAGLSAIISSVLVENSVVFFYKRPRPYIALPYAHKLIAINSLYDFRSFPSSHALFFFALSASVYCYNKRLATVLFILSTLIVIARVFVGMHWPSDILAGAGLGIMTGYIVGKISTGSWFAHSNSVV
jgi:undecaprenyl-diphosphatase